MTPEINDVIDFHVHSAPSVHARHESDGETARSTGTAGVARFVLKAHEGSSAERAQLIGPRAVGGIVLNSTVGGANPDAVEVAARLGARVVWLPTLSSDAHLAAVSRSATLEVHRAIELRRVPVVEHGVLGTEWYDVLDVVAQHDMILASGHVPVHDALTIFQAAHARGARRFLINHPLFDFMDWSSELVPPLQALDVRIEVGCVADLAMNATVALAHAYESSLLVFGSDLGHVTFPTYQVGVQAWLEAVVPDLGEELVAQIMAKNGRTVLDK